MTQNANAFSTISIVASDLDGTLLTPDHQLAEFTKQTLKQLHLQGYTFIFATGRHHVDVAHFRKELGIPAYMITSNGARVHDTEDNLIHAENVNPAIVQPVIDCVKQDSEVAIHLFQNDEWLVNKDNKEMLKYHEESGFTYSVFDHDQAPSEGIAKVFFIHDDHEHLVRYEELLNQTFGDQLNIAFSTPQCLEVMAAGVSKGHALEATAEKLEQTLEHCIAFGDGMNDVEMLSMASIGKIMGTAHPKVKIALPEIEVIGSNAEESVAHYLTEHLLK